MANASDSGDKGRTASDTEKLQADIERIKADLASLLGTSRDIGRRRARELKEGGLEQAEELRRELDEITGRARRQGEDAVASIEETIQERPLLSLLAAFGLGIVISQFLSRR